MMATTSKQASILTELSTAHVDAAEPTVRYRTTVFRWQGCTRWSTIVTFRPAKDKSNAAESPDRDAL